MSKKDDVFNPVGSNTPIVSFQESIEMFRHIEGRMLTIIDASFSDLKQREAVKSLIRMSLNDVRDKVENRWKFLSSNPQGDEPWDFSPSASMIG